MWLKVHLFYLVCPTNNNFHFILNFELFFSSNWIWFKMNRPVFSWASRSTRFSKHIRVLCWTKLARFWSRYWPIWLNRPVWSSFEAIDYASPTTSKILCTDPDSIPFSSLYFGQLHPLLCICLICSRLLWIWPCRDYWMAYRYIEMFSINTRVWMRISFFLREIPHISLKKEISCGDIYLVSVSYGSQQILYLFLYDIHI